nr:DUF4300 family protein [Streptococcus equi]
MMKKVMISLLILATAALGACQASHQSDQPKQEQKEPQAKKRRLFLSNMNSAESQQEVRSALSHQLKEANVNAFMAGVQEYNSLVGKTGLTGAFTYQKQPDYDVVAIDELWLQKQGDFIGTNCRINTFMLLKDTIAIKPISSDDTLLFMDEDAITTRQLFTQAETERFKQLFSRVKTEATKDIQVHAKHMQEHFSAVSFNDQAKMLAVVIHDQLDGDYLFIGHVGVLVEHKGKYLFVEKLSFQEPYQAILFDQKQDCYQYLYHKYKTYQTKTSAEPFLMENNKAVNLASYRS